VTLDGIPNNNNYPKCCKLVPSVSIFFDFEITSFMDITRTIEYEQQPSSINNGANKSEFQGMQGCQGGDGGVRERRNGDGGVSGVPCSPPSIIFLTHIKVVLDFLEFQRI